jgi:hypothetical protein
MTPVVLALAMLLMPAQAGEAEARLAEAHEAYDALEMERAAAILEPLVASPDIGDDVRGRAWLALGLTRASMLDTDGARAAFTAALAIDASLAPPAGTSPKVAVLFEKTRAALGIEVSSRPARAPEVREPEPVRDPPPPREPETPEPVEDARVPWLVAGGALVGVGAVAGAAALFADASLGNPTAGRTRADYEGTRSAGIAALGTSVALLLSGAAVVGAAFSLVEAP